MVDLERDCTEDQRRKLSELNDAYGVASFTTVNGDGSTVCLAFELDDGSKGQIWPNGGIDWFLNNHKEGL